MVEKRERKKQTRTIEELKAEFLRRHFEWKEVENPQGYASGEGSKRWMRRSKALDTLVRAKAEK
ncbi:MAG: hypothetical protein AAB573_04475 [Patescibacteria group bacterium]